MNKQSNAILLVGNGINQAFEKREEKFIPHKENWEFKGMSWESIVKQIIFNCNPDIEYEDISKLPMTLQIVIASKDDVKKTMKALSESMIADKISEEKDLFLKELLNLPVENIITTNYSYELEQAAGIKAQKHAYFKCRKDTEDGLSPTIKKLRLHTYSDLQNVNKRVWHIHGDAATPDSVIMGHFYYGKLLREIQMRIKNIMPYYKWCEKNNSEFKCKSWVDLFLSRDVYILGFGYDFSEMDLWWLAACKKLDFSDKKIHYYAPKGEIKNDKRALFDAYNIILHEEFEVKNKDYITYYKNVIDDIRNKLKEGTSI